MTTSSAPGRSKAGEQRGVRTIAGIIIAACLIFWVFVFSDSGWGPILTPLSIQLHVSLVTVGLFYVLWSTGYLPGALVGGAMLDLYGPRRVLFGAALIVFCGILSIFVGLLLPRFVPLGALLAIAGLAGIGGGVIDATTNGVISAAFAHRRGMALNLFNLLFPLCFIVVALFSLLGIPASYRVSPEVRPGRLQRSQPLFDGDPGGEMGPRHQSDRATPLFVTLAPVIVVMIFTAGISSTVRAWAPSYLHVAFGQTPAIAAVLSSITWALSALSRLGAAALILRIGSWRMVMLGILVTLLGLVSMMLSPNAVIATLAIALTSIGLSPLFATCLAIGSERVGRSPGSVAGILLFMSGISTVFCGWFFGFLLNTVGPLWAVLFCLTFVLLGGLMAIRLR